MNDKLFTVPKKVIADIHNHNITKADLATVDSVANHNAHVLKH